MLDAIDYCSHRRVYISEGRRVFYEICSEKYIIEEFINLWPKISSAVSTQWCADLWNSTKFYDHVNSYDARYVGQHWFK